MVMPLIWLATAQPWLGLDLHAQDQRIVILKTAPNGPTANLALVGARLLQISAEGHAPIALTAEDLIEEPDTLGEQAALLRFYARQDQIARLLRAPTVVIEVETATSRQSHSLSPVPNRPLGDLPLKLWSQIFVGLIGVIIGAWVVTLRPKDAAAWLVLVTGVGLAMAAGSAALYSARELALSATSFHAASRINSTGTLVFGIGILSLFLIYPRRILPKAALPLPALAIAIVIANIQLNDWPKHVPLLQDAVAATMLALLAAIAAQIVINRRDPAARAMLGWLGLSVGLGAGGFVLTAIVPTLLGQKLWLEQSTAFLFFLLIYAGIAMGVARYRLFDLAEWSLGILTYGLGVALLLLLDAALIYGLALDRAPALGIALAVVGLVYLPLRGRLAASMRRVSIMPPETLFARITEIAYALDPVKRLALLRGFWSDLYQPLHVTTLPAAPQTATALQDDGCALTLAPVYLLPALRLEWAGQGARLFSSADLARARAINAVIDKNLQVHQTYLEAVTSERSRINRDMHDNIGVLLLSALHATDPERKDLLIRQTLTDLREIISNPDASHWQLPLLLADLRAEIASHLEAANISLDWQTSGIRDLTLAPKLVHILRSFLREGTSNIVRHAKAKTASIRLSLDAETLCISLADDGQGFDPSASTEGGTGRRNLATRMQTAGGSFDFATSPTGTTFFATLPLHQSEAA